MKRLFLLAGAATLAVATAAYAGPGGGHGDGGPHGGGGGGAPEAHGGGGGPHGGGGGGGNPHFGGDGGPHGGGGGNPHFGGGFAGPAEHGGPRFAGPRMAGGQGHGGPHFAAQRFAGRPQGGRFAAARQYGQPHMQMRMAARQAAHGNAFNHAQAQMQRQAMVNHRANEQAQRMAAVQQQRFAPNMVYQQGVNPRFAGVANPAGYGAGGCPPGLAKKPVPCVPPGLAAKLVPSGIAASPLAAGILAPAYAEQFIGQPLPVVTQAVSLAPLPAGLEDIYPPTPQYYYQYGDGYVYQVDRTSQLINALMPLFGLGYTVGQPLPMAYANSYVPPAMQPFYPQSPYANYSYDDGYVYQVDPMTGMIADVIPTLGYGYGVGQMLPASYSAYNLPYQYRPIYPDTSDYYYRYAPGAIYQVNPTSGLIQSVVALLTGGMTVGQPLPTGYDVYNVPLDYRAQYYDTPNTWYRYADGNIYAVDPNTGLVTGIVQTVV